MYKLGTNGQYVLNQTIPLNSCNYADTVTLSDDGLWLASGIDTSGSNNGWLYVFYNNGSQFNPVQNMICGINVISIKISSNGSLLAAGCQYSA